MFNPKYSVCITCRNEAKTIRASLDSILNQIDDRFEVIVVDSKSTDGTLEILKEYVEHGKIKLIVKNVQEEGVDRLHLKTRLENT
ncbi:MAG: glycosyltransferase [Thermoproteota archaeon]